MPCLSHNAEVRVGFTESQLTVMAGQMQNVCMLVDGQLRRNLIISLSISEENLDLGIFHYNFYMVL